MESISINSTSEFKYNLDAGTTDRTQSQCDTQNFSFSISSSKCSCHNSNINYNRKRRHSIPFTSKRDPYTPIESKKILSRLISQSESTINDSKNIDNLQISAQIDSNSSKKTSLSLPDSEANKYEVHSSTDLQSDVCSGSKFRIYESDVSRIAKQSLPTISANKNTNLLETHNSINTSSDEDAVIEIKCQLFSSKSKQDIRIIPEHLYEEIDEINNLCTMKCSEFNTSNINASENGPRRPKSDEIQTFFTTNEELEGPVNQRCQRNQCKLAREDYEEPIKVEMGEHNIENDKDEIWKTYIERPILPLKPLQKQRSMSCINLVQTIKGFSKRRTSANSRNLSPVNHIKNLLFPENALIQKKELYTSAAHISGIRTELVASADLTVRRMNDTEEYFAAKNVRQSLLPNYTWFHPINAKEASKRLLKMQQNGAFLIRPASNPTSEVLHTLCVVFSRCVYNFHIKCLKDGQITLGKRKGQRETFLSLLDMIKYHQTVPISINLTESNQVAHVYLLITPPK